MTQLCTVSQILISMIRHAQMVVDAHEKCACTFFATCVTEKNSIRCSRIFKGSKRIYYNKYFNAMCLRRAVKKKNPQSFIFRL